MPFAHECDLENYLDRLIAETKASDQEVAVDSPAGGWLNNPFREPTHARFHRWVAAASAVWNRGHVPHVWCAAFSRAPRWFDIGRWAPPRPSWMIDHTVWAEPPYAATYVASALAAQYNPASVFVYNEYYCHLLAGWVHTLRETQTFVRLSEQVISRFGNLPTHRLADGPGGAEALRLYENMRRAHRVFPWGTVIKDVVRHDPVTREATEVYITVDSTCEYGFDLRHECRGFDLRPDLAGGVGPSGVRGGVAYEDSHQNDTAGCGWRLALRRSLSPRTSGSSRMRVARGPSWPSPATRVAVSALFGDRQVRLLDDGPVLATPLSVALARVLQTRCTIVRSGRSARGPPGSYWVTVVFLTRPS